MPRGRMPGKAQPSLELGEFRRKAGVSLEWIVEQTKISRRFLEAIETGTYGELPGGVFDISYLRQYAKATGYEVETLLEHYRNATGERPGVKVEMEVRGGWGLRRFFSQGQG